jgi:phosphonatase-like hydrolase
MIDLVVFDLAGTTVKENFDVQRMLKNSFAKLGLTISIEQASQVMGIPKPIAIKRLLETMRYDPISEYLIQFIHRDFVENMILFYETDSTVVENEGVTETFKTLKKHGIKIIVDTGFDRPIVDPLLERMGWEKNRLIDGSVTSDEVAHGRPHPDLIFRAMEMTGLSDVRHVAKVGDTAADLEEGNSAGCGWVIGITSGAFTREQLQMTKHSHLIARIPEILNILDLH